MESCQADIVEMTRIGWTDIKSETSLIVENISRS
jgi:hypothetical protein